MQYALLRCTEGRVRDNQYDQTATEKLSPSLSLSLCVYVCVCVPERLRQLDLAGPTPDVCVCVCVYICVCMYVYLCYFSNYKLTSMWPLGASHMDQ